MRPKKLSIVCSLLLAILACSKEEAPKEAPPPKVTVIVTAAQEVPLYQEFVGQIFGLKDIAISARVEGFLEGIHFQEGSEVEKGQLLYTLESQTSKEKVAAQMSRVAEAKTISANAKGELRRIKPLAEVKAVSQSDLDTAVAMYEASVASVEAAQANLRALEIQLGYTKIYSPISGIIGKTQAKVGDFVGRNPNPVILNTVSQVDTVLVNFFITESQYLEFARLRAQAAPSRQEARQFELILADESVYEFKGKADFLGREVDPTTGALLVQASFPNPEKLLRPGQFAKVRVEVEVVKDGILIPQRCVSELQGLFSVFVVGANNTVERREVKVGPKVKESWLIVEGLKPGEKVVYEGLQMVRDGTVVEPAVKEIEPLKQERK
ncbi:MAG: efflux RND transporter periplasmic adaptor subunit [Desulfobacterales bacterium]|nr:efflux RND transporter periplasmic adaptor subunit [Desulfobacterales bacterium]